MHTRRDVLALAVCAVIPIPGCAGTERQLGIRRIRIFNMTSTPATLELTLTADGMVVYDQVHAIEGETGATESIVDDSLQEPAPYELTVTDTVRDITESLERIDEIYDVSDGDKCYEVALGIYADRISKAASVHDTCDLDENE